MNRGSLRILRALLSSYQRPVPVNFLSFDGRAGAVGAILAQARLPRAAVQAWILLVLAGGCVAFLFGGLGVSAGVSALGFGGVWIHVLRRASMNRRAIDRELPALLTSVASAVRAGIDPLSALLATREYFPKESALMHEVEKIRDGLAKGAQEEAVLETFLTTYGSQEGELFKRCLILSRRHGSSLAEPLYRITRVVRQRQSFRRKINAALAMHRMSAVGIALCAMAMGALQYVMNPHAFTIATQHPTGSKLLIVGIALMVIGVVWMMCIGREAASR